MSFTDSLLLCRTMMKRDSFWSLNNHTHVPLYLLSCCRNQTMGNKPPVFVEQSIDFLKLNPAQIIQLTTTTPDFNLWLAWLAQEAILMVNNSCVACASARPLLHTD